MPHVSEPMAQSKKIFGKNIEWQIGKQLGNGTTGEVYEALNIDTGETFAVKMINLIHPYLGLDQQKVKSVKKEIQRYK
jgi:serine/threonine protein kinase